MMVYTEAVKRQMLVYGNAQSGRAIFHATMAFKMFHIISKVIRFNDQDRSCLLLLMYNQGTDVTVDECLVPFGGCCAFKHYMHSKPGKYCLQLGQHLMPAPVWKMQIYNSKKKKKK